MDALQSEQKIKNLLRMVAQQGGSDLHLVVGRYPTVRVDGRLYPVTQEEMLTADMTASLARAIMGESSQKQLAEKGQTDFSYSFEDNVRFRVNVFRQKGSISVAMRLISGKIKTLEELNIPAGVYDFARSTQGLFLVTGPVGHGKSTTLAALIDYINHNQDRHIITIEDPIEYVYEQDRCIINQREVGIDTPSFHEGLRSVFREDANVVMIGEMRDWETISTAMTAAETGHLIFGTLHTNDTAQTIDRIVDVFPSNQQNQIRTQLANVLLGVISQRLIPKVGGGRVPALEIMIKNTAIENLIRENKSYQIDSVIETSLKDRMVAMDKSLADLVQRGIISSEDAFLYCKSPDFLTMLLGRRR